MLNPDKTLAIILGVSNCPRAENLQPLPQCKNSADDFHAYLRTALRLPKSNIINLFDSPAHASEQMDKIEDWLAGNAGAGFSDLFVYYSGHGGFTRNDQAYFLAVQRTRSGSEGATSIRYVDLASSIRRHADSLRKYLILDCCFAASAVLRTQTDFSQLVLSRVEDELPPSGTAVLCSSAAKLVSIAPAGERYTMFSGAFLQCLKDGVSGGDHFLTFEDVGKRTQQIIRERFPNDAVRPELHVPDQHRGNPSKVPLFPNVLWSPASEAKTLEERHSYLPPTPLKSGIVARLSAIPIEILAGFASGVVAAFLTRYVPLPVGVGKVETFPPLGPAFCLAIAFVVTARSAERKLTILSSAMLAISIYLAWAAAWDMVILFVEKTANAQTFDVPVAALVISPFAGFIGAFVLAVLALIQFGGARGLQEKVRSAVPPAMLLAAVAFLAFAATDLFKQGFMELPFNLALFVPWHMALLVMFKWKSDGGGLLSGPRFEIPKLSRTNFALAGLALSGYLFLTCFLVGFLVLEMKIALNELPIVFAIGSTEFRKNGSTNEIEVNYQVAKTIPTDVECKMELGRTDSPESTVSVASDATANAVSSYFEQQSSVFSVKQDQVKQDQLNDLSVRLNCTGPRLSNYKSDWVSLSLTKRNNQ
jgi:hypothetical protein